VRFSFVEYNVNAGESSVGAVTFQMPPTVTLAKIEWSANGDFGRAQANG
jgi:hypothetical protein